MNIGRIAWDFKIRLVRTDMDCFLLISAHLQVCAGSLVGTLLRFSLGLIEMYLFFFLSMKEQVINSSRPVGKCNPA